jgi:hypothetical protein
VQRQAALVIRCPSSGSARVAADCQLEIVALDHRTTHLVKRKVLQQTRLGFGLMIEKDLQDLAPSLVVKFLSVTRIGDGFLLGSVHQANVPQGAETVRSMPASSRVLLTR